MKVSTLIYRFSHYYKPYIGIMLIDLFCASLTTLCELVLPLMVRYITDLAINDIGSLSVNIILIVGTIYLLLRFIDLCAHYFMASTGHIMGAKIETDMRKDLFSHLQKLSFSYYSNTKVGQIMARITSDLFDITEFSHHCPEEFFIAGVKFIVIFIVLAHMNLTLTLALFVVIPVMIVFSRYYNKKMRRAFKESREQVGEINAQVEDSLLGIRVVKSFANESIEEEKFKKGNHLFLKTKRMAYHFMAGLHASNRFFDGMLYLLVMVLGGVFLINGEISPADYSAYLLYISTLLTTIRRIIEFTEQFMRGMTGIERFVEIMDAPVEIQDKPCAKELSDIKGDIDFDHVSFMYDKESGAVLSDINVSVKAGEHVALVGPSGAGKSTLCNLIPRFYDTTSGRILIDGLDIKDVTLNSLRKNIGVVQQDVYLFSGTIYENIEYGNPGATKEEIENAAKLSGAHNFIMKLPNGYDTYVGERGVRLSGGEKQRISIARVFLKDPKILILDEATSSLDNENELLVQKSLEVLSKGRTTFTIAHRLTTIRNATQIWVLTEEGIEEKGTHNELMDKKGLYYSLQKMYEF